MIRRVLVLLLIVVGTARADTASRLYEQGRYAEALERYQKAAEKQTENWPLFYDLGAAAYKAGRPDEAAKAFERALGSSDPALQAKAFYNLGNSYYRLGEAAEKQSIEQAMPHYQHSLKSYENSLAVQPQDADAKFNRDMVKKKIQELKKQQQEQQQQNQQNQQQQQQNQQQQTQQQQNQSQQNQQQQSQQQQQQAQQQNQQQQVQQSSKPEDKQGQKQQEQQEAAAQEKGQDKKQSTQPEEGDPGRAQATALLDNLREDEKNWNFYPELLSKTNQLTEPEKDW